MFITLLVQKRMVIAENIFLIPPFFLLYNNWTWMDRTTSNRY